MFEQPEEDKMAFCERHRLLGNYLYSEGVLPKAAEQYKTVDVLSYWPLVAVWLYLSTTPLSAGSVILRLLFSRGQRRAAAPGGGAACCAVQPFAVPATNGIRQRGARDGVTGEGNQCSVQFMTRALSHAPSLPVVFCLAGREG